MKHAPDVSWPRTVRKLSALLIGGAVAGCPQAGGIWLAGQAGPGVPIFTVGKTAKSVGDRSISGIHVWRCADDKAVWVASLTVSNAYPRIVVYGQAPEGFRTEVQAEVLTPGCYRAYVGGAVGATFRVDSLGEVHPDSAR